MHRSPTLIAMFLALMMPACGSSEGDADARHPGRVVDIGLVDGLEARLVVAGLINPADLAVSPGGLLAICEAGRGHIVTVTRDEPVDHVTGFTIQPGDPQGIHPAARHAHGPLSLAWINDTALAAADAGHADGRESVLLIARAGPASQSIATNPIPPTTASAADLGEGELRGMSITPSARTLYLCGRAWVLRCDIESHQLHTFARSERAGIASRRPLDTIARSDGSVLVLYAAAGDDGAPEPDRPAIVLHDGTSGTALRHWVVPGVVEPVSFALAADGATLVLVDASSPHDPARGRLLRITLADSAAAETAVLATGLTRPTGCAFAPDGRLYLAEIGEATAEAEAAGRVVVIRGLTPPTGG